MGPFIESKMPREIPYQEPPAQPIRRHRAMWVDNNIRCNTCGWITDATTSTGAVDQWNQHRTEPVPPSSPPPPDLHRSRGLVDSRLVCTCGWSTDSLGEAPSGVILDQFSMHRRTMNH